MTVKGADFNCPKCMSVDSKVKNSRFKEGNRYRRRECRACGHRYTTTEVVLESEVVKAKKLVDMERKLADMELWNNLGGTA